MEALCNISFVDFLIGYLYDLNILIKRRYSSAIRLLSSVEAMVRMNSKGMVYLLGFFSAFFYALNVPLSKRLISKLSSNTLLFILYFGAAIGFF